MRKPHGYIIVISCFIATFNGFLSCKKFVEVSSPRNQLVTQAAFQDSANATASVVGLYVNMLQTFGLEITSGGVTVYTALASDEMYTTELCCEDWEFNTNSVKRTNLINEAGLYGHGYNIIYGSNACIEGLNASSTLTTSVKNQLLGEAKFIRAFIYFQLVNLYGAIPLITTTEYNPNSLKPRSPIDNIFIQIEADLLEAELLLPSSYVSPDKARPNKYTVGALLSKVYLYQQKWGDAEIKASEVINGGQFVLEDNLDNVFLATSTEAIWKMPSVFSGIETWEGYFLLPGSPFDFPKYVLHDSLLNSFEADDSRKSKWIDSNDVGGIYYAYPYKYKLGFDGLTTPLEHYVMLRLAEMYLVRAEARIQQMKLTDGINDLNVIRDRADLASLSLSLSQASAFTALEQERRHELFCEWGNRWFDLKRWDKAHAVLSVLKGTNWQPTDVLFPIPQLDIERNPNLTQNPGY